MLDVLHSRNEQIVRRDQGLLDPNYYVDIRKFHGGVGSLDVLRGLRSSRQHQRPLSLNVQIPANFRQAGQVTENYLQCLAREIDLVGCHLSPQQRIEQFHLSGIPAEPAQLQQLMAQLHRRFNFLTHESGDYSADIELQHTNWATMGLLRDQGFNHVSIGVPDIGSAGEQSVARYQNPAPIHSLIDAARTFDYRSVSVDLGYGHAWQTPQTFALKLSSLIELEPDRLQVFDYAHAPKRYAQSIKLQASSEEDKALMRRICFEQLLAAGYQHIGLGQFVRPDDDLAIAQERGHLRRNCQGFTRHGYCDHVGFGLGAISQFDTLYGQNTEVFEHYMTQLQQGQLATVRGWRCEDSDQVRQRVTERLSCDLELDILAIETRYGIDFQRYFANAWRQLEAMARTGLVELGEQYISILPAGRLEVDAICQLFEQDVNNSAPSSQHDWIDHDASI